MSLLGIRSPRKRSARLSVLASVGLFAGSVALQARPAVPLRSDPPALELAPNAGNPGQSNHDPTLTIDGRVQVFVELPGVPSARLYGELRRAGRSAAQAGSSAKAQAARLDAAQRALLPALTGPEMQARVILSRAAGPQRHRHPGRPGQASRGAPASGRPHGHADRNGGADELDQCPVSGDSRAVEQHARPSARRDRPGHPDRHHRHGHRLPALQFRRLRPADRLPGERQDDERRWLLPHRQGGRRI